MKSDKKPYVICHMLQSIDGKITGKFFQDGSEDVFIHYGFGHNWDNINEIQMEKTE